MANKATADSVRADMAPPNFRAAVQQIRTTKAKKDRISGITGEISQIYAKVEGFKVDKKAGRVFYMLDNLEHDERMSFMRSLNGLIDAAGWETEAADLVDSAENKVVQLRVGGVGGESVGDDEDIVEEALAGDKPTPSDMDDVAGEFEASEEELAKQVGRGAKAKDPAPGTGAAARAAMKAASAQEPYTGDNSDLANPQGSA